MAAYAGLVSVMHIIRQLQVHPSPPISLDQKHVETLTEKVTFMQKFLEDYLNDGSQEAYNLESRIRDAAHAVEDVIEFEIVNRIHGGRRSSTSQNRRTCFNLFKPLKEVTESMGVYMLEKFTTKNDQGGSSTSTSHGGRQTRTTFYRSLEEVIKNMDPIMLEVLENIKAKNDQVKYSTFNPHVGSSIPLPPIARGDAIVAFDDAFVETIMDKLTNQQLNRQIIPIVGMGGIGKTTLARFVYVKPLIKQHFYICVWTTISVNYNVREILLEVLVAANERGGWENLSDEELGVKVHKTLSGRSYLIVMDDMWSVEVWDKLKFFFPDNKKGSRIILTTRLSKLASHFTASHDLIEMNLLDDDKSWILFSKEAFGEEGCPLELKDIAKKIGKACKGLPLSIAVIGGLLAKSEKTPRYLEHIAGNLNAIVNLEDGERCLKILSMSYVNLPVHLKPCFLYMGVFSEDEEIRVSRLIGLWVAEGFLKPVNGKCLEEVARDYLKDLIDRKLVLPSTWGSGGRIKSCKIHDLLRDLCLREAQKEKFHCLMREGSPDINTQRRIVVDKGRLLHYLQSTSLAQSFKEDMPALASCRLFRVLDEENLLQEMTVDTFFQLVNLRYINSNSGDSNRNIMSVSPCPLALFWNLQTLIIEDGHGQSVAPSEIWRMSLLRHLQIGQIRLPDPPSNSVITEEDKPMFVLRYLHTLSTIINFRCDEDMVSRIPNIKKLKISYEKDSDVNALFANNLVRLLKLESLSYEFQYMDDMPPTMNYSQQQNNLTFPHSLKKLSLWGSRLDWEEMSSKVGSLPHLQVLCLGKNSCKGPRWEPEEGQFCSLKCLRIQRCENLEEWNADETNFPCLEKLQFICLNKLKEVPSGIGDIPTLKSIHMRYCSHSSVISVKEIVDEQASLENLDIQVEVLLLVRDEILENLDSPNFKVRAFR